MTVKANNMYISKKKTKHIFAAAIILVALFILASKSAYTGNGIVGSAHDLTSSGPAGENMPGLCQTCHIPHKAQDIRLWFRPATIGPQWDNSDSKRACLDCHGYDNYSDLPYQSIINWGSSGTTPVRITDKTGTDNIAGHASIIECGSCHKHPDFISSCELCHGYCADDPKGDWAYGAPDYENKGPGETPSTWCKHCHNPGNPNVGGTGPGKNGHHQKACNGTDLNANSHDAHLRGADPVACGLCHARTIDPADNDPSDGWTLLNPSQHMRKDVPCSPVCARPNGSGPHFYEAIPPVGTFGTDDNSSYNMDTGKKRCFRSCHGSYTAAEESSAPQWGGTLSGEGEGSCFKCHGGTENPQTPRPVERADYKPNKVNKDEYINSAHGQAPFAQTNFGCLSENTDNPVNGCHSTAARHYTKDPNNPYRIPSNFIQEDSGINGFCEFCHDGNTAQKVGNHTKDITGSKRDWPFEPKCVDCHDPHGDKNANGDYNDYLIKKAISRDYGSTRFGSPTLTPGVDDPNMGTTQQEIDLMVPVTFTLSDPGYGGNPGMAGDYYNLDSEETNGICQICHTQTSYYRQIEDSAPVYEHDIILENDTRCTSCHTHMVGFGCGGCHSMPPDDPQHYTHTTIYGFNNCQTCHYGFSDNSINPDPTDPSRANHPSRAWLDSSKTVKDVHVRFPTESDTEPYFFPGGTRISNGSVGLVSQSGGEVTCNVGCHNPIISMSTSLAKDRNITVKWQGNLGNLTCINCHDDIINKFSDEASHSSKHPVNPNNSNDCFKCHDLIYPFEKVEIITDEFSYHTNWKMPLLGNPPSWPQNLFVSLFDKDTSDTDTIYYKMVSSETLPGYSLYGDPDNENKNNMNSFCVNCHDGDDDSWPDAVFSQGGGAPNIERWTFWEKSMHATGGEIGVTISCLGTADMSKIGEATGCHGNAHGSKKVKLLGPANTAASLPNYFEEEEGFCFNCHNATSGIKNIPLGVLLDSDGDGYCTEPGGMFYSNEGLDRKNFPADDPTPAFLDIESAFNAYTHHPVNDTEQASRGVPAEVECTTCHGVHWVSGKWKDTPNNKSPISKPSQLEAAKADQFELNLLWGDNLGEKAIDYARKFQGYGSEVRIWEPDGYCCDGQMDDAIYADPRDMVRGEGVADTATFCLECHTDPTKVNTEYILGITNYSYSWDQDMHGGRVAGRPSPTGDSYQWWYGDGTQQGVCDQDAGVSEFFTFPFSSRYNPQAQRERVIGANFVMICTDCHESHGSVLPGVFRERINDDCPPERPPATKSGKGNYINFDRTCLSCHWYFRAHHWGMRCDQECHMGVNNIHKMGDFSRNGWGAGTSNPTFSPLVSDAIDDCAYPPSVNTNRQRELVLHWDFDEPSGFKANNYYNASEACTNCGGANDLFGVIVDNLTSTSYGSWDNSVIKRVASTHPDAEPSDYAIWMDKSASSNAATVGSVQLHWPVNPATNWPVWSGTGPVTKLQDPEEFTISFWMRPKYIECNQKEGHGMNNWMNRTVIANSFWVKNWRIRILRFNNDDPYEGKSGQSYCTDQGPDYDVIRFFVAVGDPNNMVPDVWGGEWPAIVNPVNPATGYTVGPYRGDAEVPPNFTDKAYSFAQTKTAARVDADPMDNTPVLRYDHENKVGIWTKVTCTWDGRYIRIFLGNKLAAETDMGGTGNYVTVTDSKFWGGPAVNHHITSYFGIGAEAKWDYTYDPDTTAGAVFWQATGGVNGNPGEYDVNPVLAYIGEIDDVKYYSKAIPPPDMCCADCHDAYPSMSDSHEFHFTNIAGPRDQVYDPPPGLCDTGGDEFINNCDNCHGLRATYGEHPHHRDGIVNFSDVFDKTVTESCDTCHGISPVDAAAQDDRDYLFNNWDEDNREIMISDDNFYCEKCHDTIAAVINTPFGTEGVDSVAQNVSGDYGTSYTYGYRVTGHGAAFASIDCTSCHDIYSAHIDSSPSNELRMAENALIPSHNKLRMSKNALLIPPMPPDNPYNPYIDDILCILCHDGDGPQVATKMVSTHSNIHNPEGKYEENFDLRCIECHNSHGTSNLSMIKNQIISTADGVERTVVFKNNQGPDSYDEGEEGIADIDDADDLCVICHMQEVPPFVSTMQNHVGGDHSGGYIGLDLRGTNCVECHKHNYDESSTTLDGFLPRIHDRCLDCHTLSGKSVNDTDSQFDLIGAISTDNMLSQHLVKYLIDYEGATGDLDKIPLSKEKVECKKCHGNKHPTPDTRVINVDNGVTAYSTSSWKGRTPDRLDEFCLSCHDGVAGSGDNNDILLNGVLPVKQIAPRNQEASVPSGPWLPTPISAEQYYTFGHGSPNALSDRAFGPNYDCIVCHVYHGNTNYKLVKSIIGKDDLFYSFDNFDYAIIDDWCTITCHYLELPAINDHTTGDSRDATVEMPQFEATHPTSTFVPENNVFYKQGAELAPNIIKYFLPNNLFICTTCHDPHGSNPANESNPDKQMLRLHWTLSGISSNGLCSECHK